MLWLWAHFWFEVWKGNLLWLSDWYCVQLCFGTVLLCFIQIAFLPFGMYIVVYMYRSNPCVKLSTKQKSVVCRCSRKTITIWWNCNPVHSRCHYLPFVFFGCSKTGNQRVMELLWSLDSFSITKITTFCSTKRITSLILGIAATDTKWDNNINSVCVLSII